MSLRYLASILLCTSSHKPQPRLFLFYEIIFMLFAIVSESTAKETSPHISSSLTQPYQPRQDVQGHLLGLSTESPISNIVHRNPEAGKLVDRMVNLFNFYGDAIKHRKRTNSPLACDPPYIEYVIAAKVAVKDKQIGEFDDSCHTQIIVNSAMNNGELLKSVGGNEVRNIIREANGALFKAITKISQIPNTPEWRRGPFRIADWQLSRENQQCFLERAHAFKKNEMWYIRADATNAPVDTYLEDLRRQYIVEFVPSKRDGPPLNMIQPRFSETHNGTDGVLISSSTLLTRWRGRVGLSSVGSMKFDGNPAIQPALQANAIAVDQASDSITVSNIAILALPMLMNLIPVSFITDMGVSSCTTLWYLIFTDIFSTLPFLIKGIEILMITNERDATVVFHVGNETFGHMEIFYAMCKGEKKFKLFGVVFIVIATFMIVIGTFLEIWAARYVIGRKTRKGNPFVGLFGITGFDAKPSLYNDKNSNNYSWVAPSNFDEIFTTEKERRYSQEETLYKEDT